MSNHTSSIPETPQEKTLLRDNEKVSVLEENEEIRKSINSTCDDLNVTDNTSVDIIESTLDESSIAEDSAISFVTIDDLTVKSTVTDISNNSLSTVYEMTDEMDVTENNVDLTENEDIVESDVMEPSTSNIVEIREKRNRDEIETPEHGLLKKPRLENSPGKKITNYFLPVTTEVPKSFSFGSVTITKVNPDNSEKSSNKENSEPNVMSMLNVQPSVFETSTLDEIDCSVQNVEEKSQLLTVTSRSPMSRAASILRLTQYRSPQVARRTAIKRASLNNWPSGSQENWIACGPSYSTPRKSSIKKSSFTPESSSSSSPISKKKRVSFNDPPVTKGLLYDPATNLGHIRRSDSIETVTSYSTEETSDDSPSKYYQIRHSDSIETVSSNSTEDTDNEQNRISMSSEDSVIVHAASEIQMEDASTQNVVEHQDISTQCSIPVNDVSTQNDVRNQDISTQCYTPSVNDASTQNIQNQDMSTQCDSPPSNDACTQNILLQDISTQCDNAPSFKDASTQNEICDNSKQASTQTSINIKPIQGSILTEGIDFRTAILDMLKTCELRLVYKP